MSKNSSAYCKEEDKDQELIQSRTPLDFNGKVTKIQENITHKRAKRSALSAQVTTRRTTTDKTV